MGLVNSCSLKQLIKCELLRKIVQWKFTPLALSLEALCSVEIYRGDWLEVFCMGGITGLPMSV